MTLEEEVHRLLCKSSKTLAVAESCTGGLLSARLTRLPGSSGYFLGGAVAYSNQAKQVLLNVASHTIEVHGAVSEETVLEMAKGIRDQLKADIALAVTGIAGPDGGTLAKPVGTVWCALSAKTETRAWLLKLLGRRQENIESACQSLLQALYEHLLK